MATFLFITDPKRYRPGTIKKGTWGTWSCSRAAQPGDNAFVYLTRGAGIKYEWRVASEARPDPHWHFECDVEYVGTFKPPITIRELCEEFTREEWGAPHTQFRGHKTLNLSNGVAARIRLLREGPLKFGRLTADNHLQGRTSRLDKVDGGLDDGDAPSEVVFLEGEKRAARTTVRNPKLRAAAKKRWGLKCYCCSFDFEQFYGSVAKNLAVVHHLELFEGIMPNRRKATVEDVRVLCANCHQVIHVKNPPLHVDELKRQVSKSWALWTLTGIVRLK